MKSAFFTLVVAMTGLPTVTVAAPVHDADLAGCWRQDPTPMELRLEKIGYFNQHDLCFRSLFKIHASSIGGNKTDIEAFDADGQYALSNDGLVLRGPQWDGWPFERVWVRCSVVVDHDALRLGNCVGAGPAPDGSYVAPVRLGDISYRRVAR